ncbi:Protein-lysine N-methyltransferase efm4 [Neocucurbitaria cava]|uniref:Protein-lysine N-methyltransferase EFM4 n=1 Tax=Neocucurbitaria cava TaxID=798079 RepID=A0A9W8XX34_9PLEO|nr:Protein-lysine N-methyltransferase efm4 [Neocucurbitaria cava]
MTPPPTHLDPSELGQKSYWDAAYTTERSNFAANAADEGTIWFSDAGAEERMLLFLEDLADEGETHNKSETSFLDLGTGNGHLLFALREEGWMGSMVGVDYSAQSVQLASAIRDTKAKEEASDDQTSDETSSTTAHFDDIAFYEWDILTQPPDATWLVNSGSGFDVVLDKGTFDAICLSQDTDAQGRRICEAYREKVEPLVKKGGRFLITSCNWTEEELRGWFGGGELVFEGKVKYPSFTFGGKTGSSVVTLCFKRG